MVLDDRAMPLVRIWCLFEVRRAADFGQPLRLVVDEGDVEQASTDAAGEVFRPGTTVTIAGTAFAEVAAVAGLVLALLIKMPILYVPFGGLAGVFILWQLPNSGSFAAICGALVQKKRDQASA